MSRIGGAVEGPAAVAADRDLGDLVPLGVESRGDRSPRLQGDVVLARAAALEDGHAETAGRAHPVVVGGGGPGEFCPITIVTIEPFVASAFPAGFACWALLAPAGPVDWYC